jgi:glycosyltransferase involved in cell wall biosynthesis
MDLSHKPRLSIGLPVYNGERFLPQAIESLLAQTFTDFRLLISDNASTDATQEICRSYASRDRRIAYHRSATNRGPAWNFNRLVGLADGEYFKWAAYDDVCAPQLVERCVDVLDRRPGVVLCYTKSHLIDAGGAVLSVYDNRVDGSAPAPRARFRSVIRNLAKTHMLFGVMRLDVLRRTHLHGAYATADMTLVGELALLGEFFEVEEPLFLRRCHDEQPHRAFRTAAEFGSWFRPDRARPLRFPGWPHLVGHLRAIARAPIGSSDKACCALIAIAGMPRRWRRMLMSSQ